MSLFTLQFSLQTLCLRVQIERFMVMASPSHFLTSSFLQFKALSFSQSQTLNLSESQFSTWLSHNLTSLFGILVGSLTLSKLILQIQTLVASNVVAHSSLRLQCLATIAAAHSFLRSYHQCLVLTPPTVYSSLSQFLLQMIR